jgi:hypothetical protein
MNHGVAMNKDVELISTLQEYYIQIEEIKRDVVDLARGLTEAQFNWRPNPQKWSIGECVEHLNVTARLFWPEIASAVNGARVSGWFSKGPYKRTWLGKIAIRAMEPPAKRKFKAPRQFKPPANLPMMQVLSQFMAFQDRLLDLMRDANGVDLGRPRLQAPGSKLIKLTLGQSFGLMAAHERRHLWQARQVKDDPNFPS